MDTEPQRPVQARATAPLLSVQAVQRAVLGKAMPLPVETIETTESIGRVVSRKVLSVGPFPPFPASTMDGYAVRAHDGKGLYPVQGYVFAGHPVSYIQDRGSVSYITTGAPLPEGADAVVRVEDTEPVGQKVRIKVGVKSGANVRRIGVDLSVGQTLIPAGSKISPVALGLLTTAGVSQVDVHCKPRIAVLSTGDEVCGAEQDPAFGQIRDSNNPTLTQILLRMGADVRGGTHIAQDSREGLKEALVAALGSSDVVISTGGVSMGELDLLPATLKELGAELHAERVNMKPGKPFVFATIQADNRSKLIFALPGNPVSAIVTFYVFVALAIRRMQGISVCHWPRIGVMVEEALPRDRLRPEFHRTSITWDPDLHGGVGGYRGISTGSQASSRLLSMLDADALIEVGPGDGYALQGTVIPALDLRQL